MDLDDLGLLQRAGTWFGFFCARMQSISIAAIIGIFIADLLARHDTAGLDSGKPSPPTTTERVGAHQASDERNRGGHLTMKQSCRRGGSPTLSRKQSASEGAHPIGMIDTHGGATTAR